LASGVPTLKNSRFSGKWQDEAGHITGQNAKGACKMHYQLKMENGQWRDSGVSGKKILKTKIQIP